MSDRSDHAPPIQGEPQRSLGFGELMFSKTYSGDRCMLSLEGELRHGNSEELYQEVLRLFEAGVIDLLLDFRNLSYCDTAGLQSLVRIYKYVQENQGLKFSILVIPGELQDILKTCRFDKFMHITDDEAVACADFQQP